ncbi:carboxypeptidase regulatory-like domain-containing protein [Nocardioides sp. zg-1308]|uniref:carboxypeptidase-like regulatory domain-containing protein n=1 Tax=Nocardioides sp. zg-1308 TaxID=2736253 RepID=UPI001551E32C|nr:carboxypeptidase-like regulatory domain-containing protein [Nocardioides sp. zg-1308]NPD03962.1 carboxypeptidase regulatory-like domain-containing protein [Nocardioides sp. zg-1308]
MNSVPGGALARLVAGGVAGAVALAGMTVGLAAPAHAAPVAVTTTLTDAAGNAIDGYVRYDQLQADGSYTNGGFKYVADGVVSLALEPGTYKLQFGDDDGLFVPEYYNDKATFDTADAVVVSGATVLAPVSLVAAPTLSGQVVAPDGKPIEDASVSLYREGDTFPFRSFSTNSQGGFAFGVPAGSYKLSFAASGYAPEFFNNKPDLASADLVAVGAGGAGVGQVVLTEGSVVAGRVTGPGGVPLERARVDVFPEGNGNSYSDLTDANGVYRVDGVRAGSYKVQFSDPVGEYLGEWYADKADRATADPVAVGIEQAVSLDAELALDPNRRVVDPATVDIYGQVVDSAGAPVIGAQVVAYDTPADADRPEAWSFVRTNRAGQYFFDELDDSTEDAWKLLASDVLEREEGQYDRLDRWFGGAQSYDVAKVLATSTPGANITLPLTGGISGTVTSESALPVDGVVVSFFDEKGNPVNASSGVGTEKNGTYTTTDLVPGTYKVQFVDYGNYFGSGVVVRHAPEWYDDATFAKAKTVTVTSGQTATGINAALGKDLKALRAPEIRGKQYLGGKLTAYAGVWAIESGTTYSHQWLRDGAVVGTGPTYQVTSADKNERLVLRTVAENDGLSGIALTSSQVIKKKPKIKVSVTGKTASIVVKAKKKQAKKIKGTVVVKKLVREDEYGAPVYTSIGKGKLRKGKASVKLKKLAKGKNKLVFVVTFKQGKLGDAEIAKTVKVKKG